MRIWLALLAAPSLALACQAVMLSLVTPECSAQSLLALHGVAAGSLVLAVVFTLLALGRARFGGPLVHGVDDDAAEAPANRRFLAVVASAVGTLSSLLILMMWVATWVLSPCS
jgi:hypothetical protein